MEFDPKTLYEKLVTLGVAWATANQGAEMLEESKHSVLSHLALECLESSQAAKEAFARRHPDYIDHLRKMVVARKDANIAKVKYESAKTYVDLMRTREASLRAASREAT